MNTRRVRSDRYEPSGGSDDGGRGGVTSGDGDASQQYTQHNTPALAEMKEAGGPQMYPDAYAVLTGSERRKGKWSPEETAYASQVVEDWQSGLFMLPGGLSLREYLAAALYVDPMRVTKKYNRTLSIRKVRGLRRRALGASWEFERSAGAGRTRLRDLMPAIQVDLFSIA